MVKLDLITSKEAGWVTFAFLSPGRSKIIYLSIKKKEIGKEREWDKGKKKEGRKKEDKNKWKMEIGIEEGKRKFGGC